MGCGAGLVRPRGAALGGVGVMPRLVRGDGREDSRSRLPLQAAEKLFQEQEQLVVGDWFAFLEIVTSAKGNESVVGVERYTASGSNWKLAWTTACESK